MTISLESIPRFTAAEALAAAAQQYGLTGSSAPLPSERDQNFLIAEHGGGKFVLKIANAGDAVEVLDFQNQAMRHVEASLVACRVQRVVTSLQGLDIASIPNPRTGTHHCLRLMIWIDGEVLADSTSRGPMLYKSIGASMAKIDESLSGFSHPGMRRVLQWDLRRADMAQEHTALLPRAGRACVERLFSEWAEIDWSALRHSVVHGDANDHNVIADEGRMVGLLDFGDSLYTATVCDLAIALAYTLLGDRDPLSVAAHMIESYHAHYPLTDAEQRVLFPLILSRLSMSVCYSAHNRARNPGDPYQVVSETAAWDLLRVLEQCSGLDTLNLVRAACAAGTDVAAGRNQ